MKEPTSCTSGSSSSTFMASFCSRAISSKDTSAAASVVPLMRPMSSCGSRSLRDRLVEMHGPGRVSRIATSEDQGWSTTFSSEA